MNRIGPIGANIALAEWLKGHSKEVGFTMSLFLFQLYMRRIMETIGLVSGPRP